MTTAGTFDLAADATSVNTFALTAFVTFATDTATALVRTMPVVVPASELYFWSEKWQSQEREFEADKAAGTLLSFETMDDAILDLMRVDLDDE